MKSFAELRKVVKREHDAGKRGRVTPTQWRTQLLATVQLASILGLRYAGRVTAHGEVYQVSTVEIPDGWHPVDFDLPWPERVKAFSEFPLHSARARGQRQAAADAELRREIRNAAWREADARDRRVKEKRERERERERPLA